MVGSRSPTATSTAAATRPPAAPPPPPRPPPRPPRGPGGDAPQRLEVHAAAVALVGKGRVRVAVAHHDLPPGERRSHDLGHELRPGRVEEQRVGGADGYAASLR